MMYEKAIAEAIDFSAQDIFMAMSGQEAHQYILNNCGTFMDENPNGVAGNGKFQCSSFTDSDDGTFKHAGHNWFCLSYSE